MYEKLRKLKPQVEYSQYHYFKYIVDPICFKDIKYDKHNNLAMFVGDDNEYRGSIV